jgi:hypothetical protein
MFSKKIQYYDIIIKTKNKNDIKLSLLKDKPLLEAIQEFNSHIQDTNEHIKKLFIYTNNTKIVVNLNYKIDRDLLLFRD